MSRETLPPSVRRRRPGAPSEASPAPAPAERDPAPPSRPEAAAPSAEALDIASLGELATMDRADFAALLGEGPARARPRLRPGQRVEGRVLGAGSRTLFVDIGGKAEATIDLDELGEGGVPAPGELLQAWVVSTGDGGVRLSTTLRGPAVDDALTEALQSGAVLSGRVLERNSGGFTVDIGGRRAFCPVSHISARPGDDLDRWVGATLNFKVSDLRDGDVVVSRRDVEREEQARAAEQLRAELRPGQVRDGTVRSVQPFGAFVDLGGVEGLVHISRLADRRVAHASEVVTPGQAVRVRVLDVEPGGRVSLSLRDADATAAAAPRAEAPPEPGGFGTLGDLLKGSAARPRRRGA